jgi:hypothetical protein
VARGLFFTITSFAVAEKRFNLDFFKVEKQFFLLETIEEKKTTNLTDDDVYFIFIVFEI